MTGKNNEDSYGIFAWQIGGNTLHLAVVADGVGGQTAGEIASKLAVESMQSYFAALVQVDEHNLLSHIKQAILASNTAVYDRAQADQDVQGMATTMVVAAVFNGRLYTSHVGDSRIYLHRRQRLYQVTQDHSWVQEAISAGLLTAEQAKIHPNRHVIRRSLGSLPETEVDQLPVSTGDQAMKQGMPLLPGDTVMLCSDGLTDMVPDEGILASLEMHGPALEPLVAELIDKANAAGGRDNITLIVLHKPETAVAPEPVSEPLPVVEAPAPPTPRTIPQSPAMVPPPTAAPPEMSGPRVVPVRLDKADRERQAFRRRLWRWLIIIGLVALIVLIFYLQR